MTDLLTAELPCGHSREQRDIARQFVVCPLCLGTQLERLERELAEARADNLTLANQVDFRDKRLELAEAALAALKGRTCDSCTYCEHTTDRKYWSCNNPLQLRDESGYGPWCEAMGFTCGAWAAKEVV